MMRKRRRDRTLRAGPLLRGPWLTLQTWWITCRKGPVLFFAGLIGLVGTVGLFVHHMAQTERQNRDLLCLAKNIYHEARGEPEAGQYAVAEVTLNRVASRRYPDSVCAVVYEKNWDRIRKRYVGAFSWTELDSRAKPDRAAWRQAWQVAKDVYFDDSRPRLKGALFYHAVTITPSWARAKVQVARIGRHIFYK